MGILVCSSRGWSVCDWHVVPSSSYVKCKNYLRLCACRPNIFCCSWTCMVLYRMWHTIVTECGIPLLQNVAYHCYTMWHTIVTEGGIPLLQNVAYHCYTMWHTIGWYRRWHTIVTEWGISLLQKVAYHWYRMWHMPTSHRYGVWADWDAPYVTLDPKYEVGYSIALMPGV